MSAIPSIAGADMAERTRRFAFLVTLIVALYGGYLYVPDATAHYATVIIDGYRGIYNSAWMGCMTAQLSAAFLTLFGFYLVRGAAERDRVLDTGDVVAATPVRNVTFLIGKFASNVGVLAIIAALMYAAAAVMQVIRAEDRHLDPVAYLLPFVLITLPGLSFVAAIAIAFDVVKPLRGIAGAVAYVFIWTALLAIPGSHSGAGHWTPFDPFGMSPVTSAMTTAMHAAVPSARGDDISVGVMLTHGNGAGNKTFVFAGVPWTAAIVLSRAAWLAAALALVTLSSFFFDRFRREEPSRRKGFGFVLDVGKAIPNVAGLRLYRAELALLANGANIFWWLGAAALTVLSGTLPIDAVLKFVLPIAMIWPVERLSPLGCRERRWRVEDIIESAPRPILRTVLAQWAAATTLGTLIVSGYVFRLATTGHVEGALACVVAMAAVAAAALACGALAGTPRLFEGAYLIVWYLGPINHLTALDFAAATILAPTTLAAAAAAVAVAGIVACLAGKVATRAA
jgi:hypothetical protein